VKLTKHLFGVLVVAVALYRCTASVSAAALPHTCGRADVQTCRRADVQTCRRADVLVEQQLAAASSTSPVDRPVQKFSEAAQRVTF